MKIKDQIRLSVIISLLMVIAISGSIVITTLERQDLQNSENLAAEVVRGGYELSFLSNEYYLTGEPRALIQLEERYASLQPIINELKSTNIQEEKSISIIQESNAQIGTTLRIFPQPREFGTGTAPFPVTDYQVTWNQNQVHTQGLIFEAWHLRHLYSDGVNELRFWNNFLVLVLMGMMLVIISVNYLFISRRFVRSIREVNAGSEVFATGNLDYRIPVTTDDEIGGLAQRLNTMAGQIRSVTASRDELEREITERRQTELALRESEQRLRRFYDSGLFGVVYWTIDGKITDANDTFLDMVGYTRDDLVSGRIDWIAMTPPEFRYLDEKSIEELKETGVNKQPFEKEYICRDGSRLPILIAGAMLDEERSRGVAIILNTRGLKKVEAELAVAQQQYRDLFKNVSIGILRSSPGTEGSIIEANPAVLRIFEADSREQLLAVHPSDLYADPGQRRRVSDEILTSGAITGMEVRFKTLKGRPFWGRITAVRKTADDGSFYFDNTIEDITERKQAEEELRESEERFRTTLDALVEGCQIIGHDWTYLYVNDAVCRQGRKNREELLGRTMMEAYPGIDTTPLFPILRRCMDERIGKHTENEFLYPDGTSGIFDLIIEPAPEGIFIFSMDITERKKAEVELQDSEERFRVIFERSTVGKSLTAPDGRLLRINRAFADMLGYTMDEMQQTDFARITHPDDLAVSRECVRALLAGEVASCRMEKRYIHKNGTIVWTDVSTSLLRDNAGTPKYFITIILDITDRKRADESLRETNEYLRNLFDYANAPIIVWDPAFRITRFNHAFEEMTGRTEQEVIGKDLAILFPDATRDASLGLIRKAVGGERWEVVEIPIKNQSGEVRIVLWNSANIVDPEGKIVSTIAQGHDITDRKQAEEEIRSTNIFLDRVIDMSPFPMWVSDNTGTIIRVNHALCDTIRLAPKVIIGSYNVLEDKNLEIQGFMPQVRAVFEDRVQIRFTMLWKAEDAGDVDFQGARTMDIDVSMYPVVNAGGELTNVVCQWVDITDRKRGEEALRESEEKYRELFENITAGFALHEIILDNDGKPVDYRFLMINEAFEKMTGLIGADIINRTVLEVLPGTEQYWIETYGEVALSGKPRLFDNYSHVLKKWFEVRVYSPKRGQFATVFTDITDRRTMENQREELITELEQKNAELERFTYTVSHDLKSPLITIKGFASLIEDDARRGDPLLLKKDIRRITDAAETMQELLADLLELSRIGRVAAPPEKTSLATIARESVDLLAGPLAERGVTVEIAPDLPEVTVDHARIREVMTNLIENAVKYLGDQPNPLIRVGVDHKGETPVFFVQDNGIGINPSYLERIFNLFEKLDSSSEGTGVGLTIVRRIIEVHGGKIWAESEGVGKGTTFRFTLPEPGGDRDPGDADHAE